MPKLTENHDKLEKELIPLILAAISKGADVIKVSYYDGLLIKCANAAEVDRWLRKLAPLKELFKELNIPMIFGKDNYISVNKYDPNEIYINVNLIDLDKFLEQESAIYQQSGSKNALYNMGCPKGLDDFLAINLLHAIGNTIFEREGYPIAYINPDPKANGSLILKCAPDDSAILAKSVANSFHSFYAIFADLCLKHNIKMLPNAERYATSKESSGSPRVIAYEFNISPSDMELLLSKECPKYVAYREGASIARLVDPAKEDIKDGSICLFPASELSSNEFILRNAGCNISETISVQLANYLKKHMLGNESVAQKDLFGHHNSVLTMKLLGINEGDILHTLSKLLKVEGQALSHESEEGDRVFKRTDTPLVTICDLDEAAKGIYQRNSITPADEYADLKSCEMPIVQFLEILRDDLIDWVRNNASGDSLEVMRKEDAAAKVHNLLTKIKQVNRPSMGPI